MEELKAPKTEEDVWSWPLKGEADLTAERDRMRQRLTGVTAEQPLGWGIDIDRPLELSGVNLDEDGKKPTHVYLMIFQNQPKQVGVAENGDGARGRDGRSVSLNLGERDIQKDVIIVAVAGNGGLGADPIAENKKGGAGGRGGAVNIKASKLFAAVVIAIAGEGSNGQLGKGDAPGADGGLGGQTDISISGLLAGRQTVLACGGSGGHARSGQGKGTQAGGKGGGGGHSVVSPSEPAIVHALSGSGGDGGRGNSIFEDIALNGRPGNGGHGGAAGRDCQIRFIGPEDPTSKARVVGGKGGCGGGGGSIDYLRKDGEKGANGGNGNNGGKAEVVGNVAGVAVGGSGGDAGQGGSPDGQAGTAGLGGKGTAAHGKPSDGDDGLKPGDPEFRQSCFN